MASAEGNVDSCASRVEDANRTTVATKELMTRIDESLERANAKLVEVGFEIWFRYLFEIGGGEVQLVKEWALGTTGYNVLTLNCICNVKFISVMLCVFVFLLANLKFRE